MPRSAWRARLEACKKPMQVLPFLFPANSYPRFFAGMSSHAVVLIAASLVD
jgi:hypothetical protein